MLVATGVNIEVGTLKSIGPDPATKQLARTFPMIVIAFALHVAIQAGARGVRHLVGRGEQATIVDYYLHHTSQMLLALLLILLLTRGRIAIFGLNLRNADQSLALLTRGFFPILLGSLVAGHLLVPLLTGDAPERFESMTSGALAAQLGFSFVLVGLSEEIVFRGLLQSLLARYLRGSVRLAGVEIPSAGVWAAVIFTIAHIGIDWTALTVTALDPSQLVLAFVLGCFYAVAYQRTGSLLAPVLAHNAVNGSIVVAELAATALLR